MKKKIDEHGFKTIVCFMFFILMIITTITGFAATAPKYGSITIQKQHRREDGRFERVDYTFYRIFDADIGFDSDGQPTGGITYSYSGTDEQKAIINGGGFFNVDGAGNVTINESAFDEKDPKYLSADAVAWVKANAANIGKKITWQNFDTGGDSRGPWFDQFWDKEYVTLHYIPFGYYFVDGGVGSLVMLTSANPDATIIDKDVSPTLEKIITKLENADGEDHSDDIKKNGQGRDNHEATVQIGDTVSYEVHVTAHKGASNYIIIDDLPEGILLKEGTLRIFTDKGEGRELLSSGWRYYASDGYIMIRSEQQPGTSSNPTFDVKIYKDGYMPENVVETFPNRKTSSVSGTGNILIIFEESWLDTITVDTDIYMVYDCIVTDDASVAWDKEAYSQSIGGYIVGNPNTATLFYGRSGYSYQDADNVWSARIVVYKYEGGGSSSSSSSGTRSLNGVKFILQRDSDKKYYALDSDGMIRWVTNSAEARTFISGEAYTKPRDSKYSPGASIQKRGNNDGFIYIDGLTNGSYTLIETDPLPGYNAAPPQTITINNQNNSFGELQKQVNIANKIGSILPSTGGNGTAPFYISGILLLLSVWSMAGIIRKRNAA